MFLHPVHQNTTDWYARRARCLVTASGVGEWFYDGKGGTDERRTRILRFLHAEEYVNDPDLVEIAMNDQRKTDRNPDIRRGKLYEDDAAHALEKLIGMELEKVGIATTDDFLFGASADRFVVEEPIGAELKCPRPEVLDGYILDNLASGGIPDKKHRHQVAFSLACTDYDLWHYYAYSRPNIGKDGRMAQGAHLHLEITPASLGGLVQKMRDGMDRMRDELARIRRTMGEVKKRQDAGERTGRNEPTF